MAFDQTNTTHHASGPVISTADLIDRLSRYEGPPEQFLINLLNAQCLVASAQGGVIMRADPQGQMEAVAVYPPLPPSAPAPVWVTQSAELAGQVFASGQTAVRSLHGQDELYGQPAKRHLAIIPLRGDRQVRGVEAFVFADSDRQSLAECVQRLELTSTLLNIYEMRLTLQRRQLDMRRLRLAMETLSATNEHERFGAAAMAFVNEVYSRWQADRVSLGLLKGRYVKIKAINHVEKFNRKMKLVQDIEAAMEECVDQDVEVLHPSPPDATYVSRSAGELSRQHGPTSVLSLPLRCRGEVVGAVTVERPADRPMEAEDIEALRLTCDLATARLVNLHENDRWFGARLGASARQGLAGILGPTHTWAKAAAVAGFVALMVIIFGKGDYRAEASFVLEPTQKQIVPAPFEGYLQEVMVKPSDWVQAGQTLAVLDTTELELQLASTRAERESYLTESAAAMRDAAGSRDPNKAAQAQIAQSNAMRLQANIDLLEYKVRQGKIVAPIDGVIVEGDLERQIGAPVKTGDVLFEISPLESLRAELLVPEDQISDVVVGQAGRLAAAGRPEQRIRFVVERINPVAEVVEQRNIFRVRARLEGILLSDRHNWMRSGMEGIAHIEIGHRSYAWLWTRRLVNWVRMRMWW